MAIEEKSEPSRARIDNALLVAGQLAGVAMRLDCAALEKYLDSKPPDFRYEKQCREAIEFARKVQ